MRRPPATVAFFIGYEGLRYSTRAGNNSTWGLCDRSRSEPVGIYPIPPVT